jgi:pilus assembly protein Flp/PilA
MQKTLLFKNYRGQGLVEYLILVALMAVATIGVVNILNQNVKSQFANVIYSLQGGKKKSAPQESLDSHDFKKTDFSNFMNGSQSGREK